MRLDLLQGTLDMLILKALTGGSRHGYGVARWIEERAGDALAVEEGSLYPALHRMTRRGWIKAQWGLSENNRRARYYGLTKAGRKHLDAESIRLVSFASTIAAVLGPGKK